jgi:2-haloacid dehalogenase
MTITFARARREVLKITGATVASSATARAASLAQHRSRVEAIGFDAFTIFDLRSIEAAVEDIFPDKGREYAAAWRTRLFEYTWLRTLNRTYADFKQVSEDALKFVFKAAKTDLTPDDGPSSNAASWDQVRIRLRPHAGAAEDDHGKCRSN